MEINILPLFTGRFIYNSEFENLFQLQLIEIVCLCFFFSFAQTCVNGNLDIQIQHSAIFFMCRRSTKKYLFFWILFFIIITVVSGLFVMPTTNVFIIIHLYNVNFALPIVWIPLNKPFFRILLLFSLRLFDFISTVRVLLSFFVVAF